MFGTKTVPLTRENLVEGAVLQCTRHCAYATYYTSGKTYTVTDVKDKVEGDAEQNVWMTDNDSDKDNGFSPHHWSMEALLMEGKHEDWNVRFELVVARELEDVVH